MCAHTRARGVQVGRVAVGKVCMCGGGGGGGGDDDGEEDDDVYMCVCT